MTSIALVTSESSLSDDLDMPLLLTALQEQGLDAEVVSWHDDLVDWGRFDAVILRSPWDYSAQLGAFIAWCECVAKVSVLINPMEIVRWSLDKHYLLDLARFGIPIVPTTFIEKNDDPADIFNSLLPTTDQSKHVVIKPAVGCYSQGVQKFRIDDERAVTYIRTLQMSGKSVILQYYMPTIHQFGETNLIYFNGKYSHAIRKEALLMEDGTSNGPSYNFRTPVEAGEDERRVAELALAAVASRFGAKDALLYARVDLIRDDKGDPRLLELEIAEPSLSLPLAPSGAYRFAEALAKRTVRP